MGHLRLRRTLILFVLFAIVPACTDVKKANDSWHVQCGWVAAKYFDDSRVIELCEAIEAGDIERINALIASGVDVNFRGKDGMTPLLWAYPGERTEAFETLLKNGADPNLTFSSDLNCPRSLHAGDSVTLLAASGRLAKLKLVMEHGGDVGARNGNDDSLIHIAIRRGSSVDKRDRIECLLEHGADIDAINTNYKQTPAMSAAVYGQYELVLYLLQSGASPGRLGEVQDWRLIHVVLAGPRRQPEFAQRVGYREVLRYLIDHGESVEAAEKDLDRWADEPPRF